MFAINEILLKYHNPMAGLEISKIFGNQFSVSCILFIGNCWKPLFGSVNSDNEKFFYKGNNKKQGCNFITNAFLVSKHYT